MWFRTFKFSVTLVAASLMLGGCGTLSGFFGTPDVASDGEDLAAIESDEAVDQAPTDDAEEKQPKPPAAPRKIVPPGVMVVPIQGAPPLSGRRMSASVASELTARNVRATSRSQEKISYVLEGKAVLNTSGGGASDFRIDWNLIAPDGLSAGKFSDRVPVAGSGWNAVTPTVLGPMARRAAAQVDILLKEHARAPSAVPVDAVASKEIADSLQEIHVIRTLTPVFIGLVEGAPGDGKLSLKNALSDALLRARVPVLKSYSEKALMVLGDVHVTPVDRTRNLFEFTWIVMRADGESVGAATSTMTVGVNRVIPAWGSVARTAAENVVGDIVALIDQAAPQDKTGDSG